MHRLLLCINLLDLRVYLNFDQIQKQLSLINKENIVEYQQSNTDIKLYWKVPREDNYTLNPFLERTLAHNQLKVKKIAYMLDYAFERFECKRNKILRYFGEKKSGTCWPSLSGLTPLFTSCKSHSFPDLFDKDYR